MYPLNDANFDLLTRIMHLMRGNETFDIELPDRHVRFHRAASINTPAGSGRLFTAGQLSQVAPPAYGVLFTFIVVGQWDEHGMEDDLNIFPVSLDDKMNKITVIGAVIDNGQADDFNESTQQLLDMVAGWWLSELETKIF